MTLSHKARYYFGGLAAFVLVIILQRIAPIRLPAYVDLLLVGLGTCFMALLYYRRTRDVWAPIFSLTGWIMTDIPPRASSLPEDGESVALIIFLAAQIVGAGLLLIGIGFGAYRLLKLASSEGSSP